MFLGIAYGLENLFNDIRGETGACAQDGPPDVPKTDRVSVLCTDDLSKHRIIHVPTRYRLLVLHLQYTVVLIKEKLELKSHYKNSIC